LLDLGRFYSFLILHTIGRTPWTGISPSQGRYLHTERHKHIINAHNTDIHALGGTRTHDSSVRASKDSSYLMSRGHRDWRIVYNCKKKKKVSALVITGISGLVDRSVIQTTKCFGNQFRCCRQVRGGRRTLMGPSKRANLNHPPTSWSAQRSLSFCRSRQYPICIPLLPIRATCPAHLILLGLIMDSEENPVFVSLYVLCKNS
jgi:hypothetical protein